MFSIHSIGDSAFLEQILIAVSMITGTGDFNKVVSIGLLLGVFMIFIQSVFQGAKEVNFQQIFVGWVLYACFFGPSTTVTIEDAYNGQVRVVSNVPIGVGFAGGVISEVGYNITNLFEVGYGAIVPSVTESHFNETLKLLNDVRKKTYDSSIFTALNAASGGGYVDVRRSWNNYIRECTLTKIDLNLMSLDDLMQSKIEEALKFESGLYGTRLFLSAGNPDGLDYTCTDGWTALSIATDDNFNAITPALNEIFGIDTSTGNDAFTKISDSLNAMGAATTHPVQYLKAAILEPLYYEAASGRYQDMQDYNSALMVNQAIQQRNTQWTAEQSMFMTVVRPMLTFFEGFIYAITPMLGFLIVLGGMGIGLAGKYMQTLIWIQLWMPVLSIINLFVHTAASNEMASLTAEGLNSMYALSSSGQVLENWIATGGLLAASTPVISLFLVTGSTYAFTGLAQRISGGDHVDEKVNSPDLVKNGPIMQNQPAMTNNMLTGAAATGSDAMMGSISIGQGLSSMTASASQNMAQASSSFSKTLGQTLSSGRTDQQSYENMASLGRAATSSHSQESGFINQRASEIMKNSGIDQSHSDAVKGVVSAVASGSMNVGVGSKMLQSMASNLFGKKGDNSEAGETEGNNTSAGIGLAAKLQANADKSTTDSNTVSQAQSTAIKNGLSFSDSEKASVTNSLASQFADSSKQSSSQADTNLNSKQLSQAAQKVVSANQSYSTTDALNKQFGATTTLGLKDAAAQVASNQNATTSLNDYWKNGNVSQAAKQEASDLYKRFSAPVTEGGYGLNAQQADIASKLGALTNTANTQSGEESQRNFGAALTSIGIGMGKNIGDVGNYESNSNIKGPAHNRLEQNVMGATDNVANTVKNAEKLNRNDGSVQTPVGTGVGAKPADINSSFNHNSGQVVNSANAAQSSRNSANEQAARTDLLKNTAPYSAMSAQEFYGGISNLSDWAGRESERAGGAIGAGATVGSSAFNKALNEINSSPESRQQFIDQTKASDQQLMNQGAAGHAAVALGKAGRNILGLAAAGAEIADGRMSFGDLKSFSLEEKGAVYAAALAHAGSSGAGAAAAFHETKGQEFRDGWVNEAMSRGLTKEQANVYAENFGNEIAGTAWNTDSRQQAVDNLAATYAERDGQGNVIRDPETNKPVLTPENQQFVDDLTDRISGSTRAVDLHRGSYTASIANYNMQTGRIGGSITEGADQPTLANANGQLAPANFSMPPANTGDQPAPANANDQLAPANFSMPPANTGDQPAPTNANGQPAPANFSMPTANTGDQPAPANANDQPAPANFSMPTANTGDQPAPANYSKPTGKRGSGNSDTNGGSQQPPTRERKPQLNR